MLTKKLICIVFALIIVLFLSEKTSSMAMQRCDLYAGDDFSVLGSGGDCKVGKKVIYKKYICHIKAGETVSITWDSDRQCKSGDFTVGLINKSGDKKSRKIGKVSNKTKKIKVSKTGIYYFYFRPNKANSKDGTVEFHFDVAIQKKKVK